VQEKGGHMIDLTDATFMIAMRADSEERVRMLRMVVDYLGSVVDAPILIGEEGPEPTLEALFPGCEHVFVHSADEVFRRARLLNAMWARVRTRYAFNHDGDCWVAPEGYRRAVEMLRWSDVDVAYPHVRLRDHVELPGPGVGCSELGSAPSVSTAWRQYGGLIGYRREAFVRAGMENEKFVSWGFEDVSRLERLERLGQKAVCVRDFRLRHFLHARPLNSDMSSEYVSGNEAELWRMRGMSLEDLVWYVSSWPWSAHVHGDGHLLFDRHPSMARVHGWASNAGLHEDGFLRKEWAYGRMVLALRPEEDGPVGVALPFRPGGYAFDPPDLREAALVVRYVGSDPFRLALFDGGGRPSKEVVVEPRDTSGSWSGVEWQEVSVPMLGMFGQPGPAGGLMTLALNFAGLTRDFAIGEAGLRWG